MTLMPHNQSRTVILKPLGNCLINSSRTSHLAGLRNPFSAPSLSGSSLMHLKLCSYVYSVSSLQEGKRNWTKHNYEERYNALGTGPGKYGFQSLYCHCISLGKLLHVSEPNVAYLYNEEVKQCCRILPPLT